MSNKINLIAKSHFIFGKQYACFLVLNKTFSNIFISLLDLQFKIVITKTSGILPIGNSKRKKLSTQAVDLLVKNLINYFKIYKIKKIIIFLKTRVTKFVWTLMLKLKYFGYIIGGYKFRKKKAHMVCVLVSRAVVNIIYAKY